jgi:hypothetical protein
MALPLLTTTDDIKAFVKYLTPKPSGATLKEMKAVLGAALADARKIATVQMLGIAVREGDRVRLTGNVGREMVRANDEQFGRLLLRQLATIPAYKGCLEWAHHRRVAEIVASDVGAHWHDHYKAELGTDNAREINLRAVCFLQLAEGAGLGEFFIGRRGQPSRLVARAESLAAFVENGEAESGNGTTGDGATAGVQEVDAGGSDENGVPAVSLPKQESEGVAARGIFIAHGRNKKPLEQLKGILDQFKVPYKVAVDEANLGRPIGTKVRETMRACNCAILIFTADEEFQDKSGNVVWRPSENVIYELGASGYLYDNRIVIMKEDDVQFPSNFRDIGYIAFAKDQLDAKSMDILKELVGFGIVKITT